MGRLKALVLEARATLGLKHMYLDLNFFLILKTYYVISYYCYFF